MDSSLTFPVLSAALRASVVRVRAGDSRGTGFVVCQDVVLTCRHVVAPLQAGAAVTLVSDAGAELPGVVLETYPASGAVTGQGVSPYPDLALIRIDAPNELPAVVLEAARPRFEEQLAMFGWAADSQVGGRAQALRVTSPDDVSEAGEHYVRVGDEAVVPGMSGAPVCNEAGFVCGYLRLTRGANSTLGGWVVPLDAVLADGLAPALVEPYESPGDAARGWVRLLQAWRLKEHGRDLDGSLLARTSEPKRINLALARTVSEPVVRWTVAAVDEQDCLADVGESDLGAGVFDAISRWARRATPSVDDLVLLGSLLHRALLPGPITELIERTVRGAGDKPLLRIRVDDRNDLVDVPWEYVRRDRRDKPLGTRQDLVLSRYIDDAGDADPPPASGRESLAVLVIVIGAFRGRTTPLDPTLVPAQLAASLRANLATLDRIDGRVEPELGLGDLEALLGAQRWDVVHYVGPAGDSPDELSFSSGTPDLNGTREYVGAVQLSIVADMARSSGARALVVQRLSSDRRPGWDPPSRATLHDTIGGSLQALVVAEQPAEAKQVKVFGEWLYKSIAAGEYVERAVQDLRRSLFREPPGTDHAAFGMITVTTGKSGYVRLLSSSATAVSGQRPTLGASGKEAAPAVQRSALGADSAVGPRSAPLDGFAQDRA